MIIYYGFIYTFVSMVEPKSINKAIIDYHWIVAMQEELNQFERNNVWELLDQVASK